MRRRRAEFIYVDHTDTVHDLSLCSSREPRRFQGGFQNEQVRLAPQTTQFAGSDDSKDRTGADDLNILDELRVRL